MLWYMTCLNLPCWFKKADTFFDFLVSWAKISSKLTPFSAEVDVLLLSLLTDRSVLVTMTKEAAPPPWQFLFIFYFSISIFFVAVPHLTTGTKWHQSWHIDSKNNECSSRDVTHRFVNYHFEALCMHFSCRHFVFLEPEVTIFGWSLAKIK